MCHHHLLESCLHYAAIRKRAEEPGGPNSIRRIRHDTIEQLEPRRPAKPHRRNSLLVAAR